MIHRPSLDDMRRNKSLVSPDGHLHFLRLGNSGRAASFSKSLSKARITHSLVHPDIFVSTVHYDKAVEIYSEWSKKSPVPLTDKEKIDRLADQIMVGRQHFMKRGNN